MNKIEKTVRDLVEIHEKLGLDFDEDYYNALQENLLNEAYAKKQAQLLVNIRDLSENNYDISNQRWVEDYEILTKTYRDDDGNTFVSEDEYETHLRGTVKERLETFYVAKDTPSCEIDEEYEESFSIYDGDTIVEGDFESYDEAEERLEQLEDEMMEEYPSFEELDFEYDEIYWNTVFNFNDYVDIDAAQKVGLGVLEMNDSGDQYLFLQGCGMDMSFQIVAYQAYAHDGISRCYIDKLEWAKQNYGESEYLSILKAAGVDIERFTQKADAEVRIAG